MSNLSGHARITAKAIQELTSESASQPIFRELSAANLPDAVVTRDILDVLSLGHWADFGQKHHFMRKFDGQSPYEAYEDAVGWIRSNAMDATKSLAARVGRYFPKGIPSAAPRDPRGRQVFEGVPVQTPRGMIVADRPSWQNLGNAVHALQDSFSQGHVDRDDEVNPQTPGSIKYVKRYVGHEKDHHEEFDADWWDASKKGFSADGRFAIEASKHLIRIAIGSALSPSPPIVLVGWDAFQNKWLKASSKLSRESDLAFDLIDRVSVGIRLGAFNLKTLSMDEDKLAKALFDTLLSKPDIVLEVFERLDEHFNSDADDVAEIFVNLVRRQGGPHLATLRQKKPLIARLIKVMDEGWTSSGEKECIRFLKTLT